MKSTANMFGIFGGKEDMVCRVKDVHVQEVVTIEQACKAGVRAFKDNMKLQGQESRESMAMARESEMFRSGERMLTKAGLVNQEDSPIMQVLSKTGEVFQIIGKQQANMETTIHHILDEGKISKASEDYMQAESEMVELRRKIALYNSGKNNRASKAEVIMTTFGNQKRKKIIFKTKEHVMSKIFPK